MAALVVSIAALLLLVPALGEFPVDDDWNYARMVQDPVTQELTPDTSLADNRYRLDGSSISSPVAWPPANRNVRNGTSDFLELEIKYQYS